MFLMYVDESGSPFRTNQKHFILAGIVVFERKTHWLSRDLEEIAQSFHRHGLHEPELHGSPMWAGRNEWYNVPQSERISAIKKALELIDGRHYRIIASVVKKTAIAPADPLHLTFEQVITRFDHFLKRQYTQHNKPQRGLLICDKSGMEHSLQALATEFKINGHQWGKLRNMSDVPLFVDSKATRLVQLADLAAYALFRKYESNDDTLFKIIANKFDSVDGKQHGLHVKI